MLMTLISAITVVTPRTAVTARRMTTSAASEEMRFVTDRVTSAAVPGVDKQSPSGPARDPLSRTVHSRALGLMFYLDSALRKRSSKRHNNERRRVR